MGAASAVAWRTSIVTSPPRTKRHAPEIDGAPRWNFGHRGDEYVAALAICEPTVVASMKRQLNAIAAGDGAAAQERTRYEASLQSPELRRRLTALLAKPK